MLAIDADDYHTLDRKQRKALGITPLNPQANDLDLLAEHLRQLKEGRPVRKPVYDHRTGTFGDPEEVNRGPSCWSRACCPSTRLRCAVWWT